jgi:hypothetical protein
MNQTSIIPCGNIEAYTGMRPCRCSACDSANRRGLTLLKERLLEDRARLAWFAKRYPSETEGF